MMVWVKGAMMVGLLALTACAAAPEKKPPVCYEQDGKTPVDGGIGGTGNEKDACAEQ